MPQAYKNQPVNRIKDEDYQGNLIRLILTAVNKRLLDLDGIDLSGGSITITDFTAGDIVADTITVDQVDTDTIVLHGSTSGAVTITVPATITSYTMTLPNAQGAANSHLRNDGSGNLTWHTLTAADLPTHTHGGAATGGSTLDPETVTFPAISDPGNPAASHFMMFCRVNAGNLELVSRDPTGAECVLCSKAVTPFVSTLTLNWIE